MKSNIIKVLIAMIIIVTIIGITYYYIRVATSSMPKEIFEKYNYKEEKFMGRNIYIISPKEKASNLKILYIHGGSYVGELEKIHWEFFKDIIDDTNASIIVPDYPLAPANTYKEVFKMMEPFYKEIIEEVGSERLIVMGDSAGGGLSLALCEKLSQENVQMPRELILISPWLDVRLENPEIDKVDDPVLNKSLLSISGKSYAGKDGMDSYLVNPIIGPTDKLGNITIITGTRDMLYPDCKRFAEKLSNVNYIEIKDAIHNFILKRRENVVGAQEGYDIILEILKGE